MIYHQGTTVDPMEQRSQGYMCLLGYELTVDKDATGVQGVLDEIYIEQFFRTTKASVRARYPDGQVKSIHCRWRAGELTSLIVDGKWLISK